MDTPICDFVRNYIDRQSLRLHMPGHKGTAVLGFEKFDITEITGADCLSHADGIIRRSEDNASLLFGCPTFYSTEGASQCIRAMLYLAVTSSNKRRPLIAAGRNAHKAFVNSAILLDFDIDWLCTSDSSYLSCEITPEYLEDYFATAEEMPCAVYITSPDYLGNTADIQGISEVCRRYGVMLTVDGAHGAYLRFLEESEHPMDLGADMCCTSAHKTLPVLTGGAYLHISESVYKETGEKIKPSLTLFGSTSPSYLILESLDMANKYLANHKKRLDEFIPKIRALKGELSEIGYTFAGNEPLKLTLKTKSYGYTGIKFAEILESHGIVPEFADPDFTVLMVTPETGELGISKIRKILSDIPKSTPISTAPPRFSLPSSAISPREAAFAKWDTVDVSDAEGCILASVEVGCPPAVPIVVCGEIIDTAAIECFKYYGIQKCTVVSKR